MYRIAWKSKVTGKTQHGRYTLDKDTAHEVADKLNKNYPLLEHWVEKWAYAETEAADAN